MDGLSSYTTRSYAPSGATSTEPDPDYASPQPYTVIARGHPFHLSRSQVEFDAPNGFTQAFLTGPNASTVLHCDRRPDTFAVIVEYLSGYDVLPVEIAGLTVERATKLVAQDAEFFHLSRLRAKADAWPQNNTQPLPRYPPILNGFPWISFEGPVEFSAVCTAGAIRGRPLQDIVMIRENAPSVPLFHFRDLHISVACDFLHSPLVIHWLTLHLVGTSRGANLKTISKVELHVIFTRPVDIAYIASIQKPLPPLDLVVRFSETDPLTRSMNLNGVDFPMHAFGRWLAGASPEFNRDEGKEEKKDPRLDEKEGKPQRTGEALAYPSPFPFLQQELGYHRSTITGKDQNFLLQVPHACGFFLRGRLRLCHLDVKSTFDWRKLGCRLG